MKGTITMRRLRGTSWHQDWHSKVAREWQISPERHADLTGEAQPSHARPTASNGGVWVARKLASPNLACSGSRRTVRVSKTMAGVFKSWNTKSLRGERDEWPFTGKESQGPRERLEGEDKSKREGFIEGRRASLEEDAGNYGCWGRALHGKEKGLEGGRKSIPISSIDWPQWPIRSLFFFSFFIFFFFFFFSFFLFFFFFFFSRMGLNTHFIPL